MDAGVVWDHDLRGPRCREPLTSSGRWYSPSRLHSASTKRCPHSTRVTPSSLATDDRQQPLTALVDRLAREDDSARGHLKRLHQPGRVGGSGPASSTLLTPGTDAAARTTLDA